MKKPFFKNTLLLALPIAICFSACSDDKESKYEPAAIGQTKIYGRVTADLILNNGTLETAPAGTKITAWIDGRSLVLNPVNGVVYPKKFYSTAVDANGNYVLTVDAANAPVEVHIDPTTFEYTLTLENGTQKKVNYKTAGTTKTGYNGQNQRLDFNYVYELQTGSELGLATIKGYVYYKYDLCKSDGSGAGGYDTQYVAAPNGTIVTATWADDNNITHTIEVPVQNGQISFTIETAKGGVTSVPVYINGRAFYEKRRSRVSGTCDIEAKDHKYEVVPIANWAKKGETTIFEGLWDIKFN
jgi:hypothetical protein